MRQAVRQVVTALSALPHSARRHHLTARSRPRALVSKDGRSALVTFQVPGQISNEDQAVAP